MTSTTNYWDNIERVKESVEHADAILVVLVQGCPLQRG